MVDGAKSKKGKNGQINRVTIQSSLSASSRCHLVSLLPTLRKGHGVVPALPLSKEEPPFRSSLKTSTKTAYLWYGVLTTGYCYARPRGCDRL